ncbi:hypothetical protein DCAR_0520960 [Daucus carota subsp. sativus]|uniref:Uncharacterized protein n=1 Tax=Daucus carota subsp. sativus TaxID=79200 RepID=A0A164YZ70_DAUCS|nr:PREDICTED: protein SENESCENCE-ASSOCIATED GENE 21, mitochondrial-like [Daucus carota subsp. sativus]WOH01576.1 hypothetical protein DCAR_0520960 [Daucus carota subsp. sativus]
MAPSKLISAFVTQQISFLTRRGYASRSGVASVMSKKGGEETSASNSWIPDPVTGYYRPEGKGNEVDAAELREMLLRNKTRRN